MTGLYKKAFIKTKTVAKSQYEQRLHLHFMLVYIKFSEEGALTILNTRPLNKHPIEILSTTALVNSDVICLPETQLIPNQNTDNIKDIYRNSH